MTELMPAIFFGHGNPMNAISHNDYTNSWTAIGRTVPRPKAVLVVSAHWYIPQSAVTIAPTPPTIHDFGGFPQALFEVQYPAPGNPELARRVKDLLAPVSVGLDEQWGLDHGTWSVLKHVYPLADIPVVQLSIDRSQPAHFHYEMGKRLAPLREEGILVIGSGNIVHNLQTYDWGKESVQPFDWAVRFEQQVRKMLLSNNDGTIIAYGKRGQDALLSIPTPEHFQPLLYILGLRREADQISFPVEGMDGGSISMLAVQVG
jgi:4,5-DOPA dioxygenase extradiol